MYIFRLSPCYVRMYGCSFFPPFLSYKIPTIHLVFVICHKYSLMNCEEKRFCKTKAVSLSCRPVLFFAIIIIIIIITYRSLLVSLFCILQQVMAGALFCQSLLLVVLLITTADSQSQGCGELANTCRPQSGTCVTMGDSYSCTCKPGYHHFDNDVTTCHESK